MTSKITKARNLATSIEKKLLKKFPKISLPIIPVQLPKDLFRRCPY
jgi:hypothetical protein